MINAETANIGEGLAPQEVAGITGMVLAYTVEVGGVEREFSKPELSASNGACVSIAELEDGGVLVGDSKNPDQTPLRYTAIEWQAFLGQVRSSKTT